LNFAPQFVPAFAFRPQQQGDSNKGTMTKTEDTRACSQRPNFHELQELQQKLDMLHQKLLKTPQDSGLQNDCKGAQAQLNDLLNKAVAGNAQDLKKVLPVTEKATDDTKKSTLQAVDKENEAPLDNQTGTAAQLLCISQEKRDHALSAIHRRRRMPSDSVRHHLCSGCGSVRSQAFHGKYPIGTGHQPMLNFCSSCRERKLENGVMDKYHFCFGCGKVRLKAFQKKHKPRPGRPFLPNYCGECTAEVIMEESMNEESVLGIVSRHPDLFASAQLTIVQIEMVPSTGPDLPNDMLRLQNNKHHTKPLKLRNAAQLDVEKPIVANDSSTSTSPTELSSFYPGRRLGSAQRRAQRASSPHPNEELRNRKNTSAEGQVEYHAPYIEDVDSASEHKTSSTGWEDPRSLENQTFSVEVKIGDLREDDRCCSQRVDQNLTSCRTPDVAQNRFAAVQYTNSSGETTVRCKPGAVNGGQQARSVSKAPRRNVPDRCRRASCCGEGSLWNSSFGQNTKAVGHDLGQTVRRPKSPLADFECSNNTTPINEGFQQRELYSDITRHTEPLPFRSSRGVFGRSCSPNQDRFSGVDYHRTETRESESSSGVQEEQSTPDVDLAGDGSQHSTGGCFQTRHTDAHNSSLSSSSMSEKNTKNKFGPHVGNEGTYSRSVFTDYSRSTDNPYYKPRRHPFPSATNSNFKGTWEWKRGMQRNQKTPDTRSHFDDHVPQPIVEEPISPPSSPVQHTKLLGK
jgi:hypothetical protein